DKLRRQEQPFEHRVHLEATAVVRSREIGDECGVGLRYLADEILIELPREPRSGRWMPGNRVDQIHPVLHAAVGGTRWNHLAAVRVDRKGEFLGGGVVLRRNI